MAASSSSGSGSIAGQMEEFQGLDSGILSEIDGALVAVNCQAETILIEENSAQSEIFLIVSGSVSRTKNGVQIDEVRGPRVSGLLHAFRGDPTFATLKAPAGATVFALKSAAFLGLVQRHSALALHLLHIISLRARAHSHWTREKLAEGAAGGLRVVCFDSKSYDKESFEALLPEWNARAPSERERLVFEWKEQRLSPETVSSATGAQAVCIFVNDQCNAATVEALAKLNVKLIVLRCAGYDGVDLKACLGFDIPVVRVPAYSPEAVAEHAVALLLALARHIHRASQRTREGNFSLHGLTGVDIHDKTIGVIGTGRIGKCFVNIAKGFGGRVIAYDAYADSAWAAAHGVTYVSLEELFRSSDIISIHCPLLDSTRHMINKDSLALMKDGVILLNTSRGAIIDTSALLEALQSGKVGSAGLDVYEHERPYFFQDHSSTVMTDSMLARLSSMKNVILTGHQAYLTHDALRAIASVSLQNIAEFFWQKKPQPLTNQVLDEWSKPRSKI